LLDILTQLVGDTELRRRIRRQAHQYIRANRTHAKAASDRYSFYAHLIDSRGTLSVTHNAPVAAGYKEIIAEIEPLFLQAMLMHREGRIPEAIEIYTRLAEKVPNFHTLWERMSQACAAIGAREQADSCNERARLLLEQVYSLYNMSVNE
jgi:hypothetical protein